MVYKLINVKHVKMATFWIYQINVNNANIHVKHVQIMKQIVFLVKMVIIFMRINVNSAKKNANFVLMKTLVRHVVLDIIWLI